MKTTLLGLILFLSLSSFSQNRDSSNVNIDSLLKRVQQLEKNQTIIVKNIRMSGKEIYTGVGLLGSGVLSTVASAIIFGLASGVTKTNLSGQKTTGISAPQICAIAIGGFGIGLSIAGSIKIAEAGKRMRDL